MIKGKAEEGVGGARMRKSMRVKVEGQVEGKEE